jgi:glycosyltransferase involved in cell wall biosynthesis
MWRLKQSLPAVGIDLTLASLELLPFRFAQLFAPDEFFDARARTPQEFVALIQRHRSAVHLVGEACEYVELLEKAAPALLDRLTLVGICRRGADFAGHQLARLDARLSGLIGTSAEAVAELEEMLPHRQGTIPLLPDWNLPIPASLPARPRERSAPLRVLFHGRLWHAQERALDLPLISRRLASVGVPIALTIVGDGPDLPRLREEFSRGRHVAHQFLPPRAPWDMAPLLEEHDVFLQLSDFDGTGLSLMEAMAAGLAPVAPRTPSRAGLLTPGQNAALFPVGDNEAAAEALTGLVINRARMQEIGRSAFATARARLKELDYAHALRHFVESLPAASVFSHPEMLAVF